MSDETSINDQIKDSISQIQESVLGVFGSQGQAAAYQMMAHAIGLAMLNAVANQQQAYILKNAITTAAVKATLESNPEEALKLADKMLSGQDIVSQFSGLKDMMNDILEIMAKMKAEATAMTENEEPQEKKADEKQAKKSETPAKKPGAKDSGGGKHAR